MEKGIYLHVGLFSVPPRSCIGRSKTVPGKHSGLAGLFQCFRIYVRAVLHHPLVAAERDFSKNRRSYEAHQSCSKHSFDGCNTGVLEALVSNTSSFFSSSPQRWKIEQWEFLQQQCLTGKLGDDFCERNDGAEPPAKNHTDSVVEE